jgi:hypothetical protein
MPGQSDSTKHGQAASTKRARAALASQEDRRSRRPLESKTPETGTRAARIDQRSGNQPKLELEASPPNLEETLLQDTTALLKRFAIVTVPKAVYEWGGYRYTNASDAIAAAKRGARK